MSDKEILEFAAKALRLDINFDDPINDWYPNGYDDDGDVIEWWNPLISDADAARMAYSLGLCIVIVEGYVVVQRWHGEKQGLTSHSERYQIGKTYPMRRAICLAAAEIGRGMA